LASDEIRTETSIGALQTGVAWQSMSPQSTAPSQSLSSPSPQSSADGDPGVQLSPTTPAVHVVAPAAAHAPTPQVVAWAG
jgi:hypothetical protein